MADVTSLYTNVPLEHGNDVIVDFLNSISIQFKTHGGAGTAPK